MIDFPHFLDYSLSLMHAEILQYPKLKDEHHTKA